MRASAGTADQPKVTQTAKKARSTVRMNDQVAHVLRALGEAAIRLSEGKDLDETFFAQSDFSSTDSRTKSDLLTVPEACDQLRVSRWMFYRLIHQQRISTITIGRRRLVSAREIDRFLSGLHNEGEAR